MIANLRPYLISKFENVWSISVVGILDRWPENLSLHTATSVAEGGIHTAVIYLR
jgi:hypothetical protein